MGRDARREQLNLLAFLQNANVVVIRDGDEFEWFTHAMCRHGLSELLPTGTLKTQTYQATVAGYARENRGKKADRRYPDWDGATLYAECQIGKESIGIYPYDVKSVVGWYGVEPFSVADIMDPGPDAVGSTPGRIYPSTERRAE